MTKGASLDPGVNMALDRIRKFDLAQGIGHPALPPRHGRAVRLVALEIGGRALFRHWIDADGDGCNTRYEVLITEATRTPAVGAGCSLSGGSWLSLYDGVTFSDPSGMDIDHIVQAGGFGVSRTEHDELTDRRRADEWGNFADLDGTATASLRPYCGGGYPGRCARVIHHLKTDVIPPADESPTPRVAPIT